MAAFIQSPPSQGSCEQIENRLLPALGVRRSARATPVERALRARFHLWIRRREGAGLAQFNFFTASGVGEGERSSLSFSRDEPYGRSIL